MSIKTYQQDMIELNEFHGMEPWPPLSYFAHLVEEVGEFGRALNHVYGVKVKKPSEEDDDIGAELADILMLVVVMATSLNIDLDKEWEKLMKKSRSRDLGRYKKRGQNDV